MDTQREPPNQSSEIPRYTLRLTFTYERMDVQLVTGQRVKMIPPPSEPQPIQRGQSGFWIELHDAQGDILYQRAANNPIRYEIEVPEDPETGAHHWQKIDHPQGMFQLLVPYLPAGQTLVLFSSPPDAFYEPATELVRFRLDVDGLVTEVNP